MTVVAKNEEDEQGVVYKVNGGGCEKAYIEETGRGLKNISRVQTKTTMSACISGLSEHFKKTKHEINHIEILYKQNDYV